MIGQNLPSISGGSFVQADQYQGPNLLVATSRSSIKASKEYLPVCLFVLGFGTLRIRCQHGNIEAEKLNEQNLKLMSDGFFGVEFVVPFFSRSQVVNFLK